MVPTGNATNSVYKEVLCWVFIIRTHNMAFHTRREEEVDLAFSRIINVKIVKSRITTKRL
jgi:hypothetical protein